VCTVSPEIEWDLPKAVGLNGTAVTGSCSITAYPRPSRATVLIPKCDYQQESIPIGNYTTKVVFTINNITKSCEHIYCYVPTFGHIESRELLIVGEHKLYSSTSYACTTVLLVHSVNILFFQKMYSVEVTKGKLNQFQ